MPFVLLSVHRMLGCLSSLETVCSAFLVEDLLATLALLKLRVAELIEKEIGVNNKGFNSDLEENSAQLNADFYP